MINQQKISISENTDALEKIKHGSLQVYVPHDEYVENLGWNKMNTEDVHRIGILDIRILNKDRNGENILAAKLKRD